MKNKRKKIMVINIIIISLVSFISNTAFADLKSDRIVGNDRYETADLISGNFSSAETVIISSGVDFPNALCATALTNKYNSPLLLTDNNKLSDGSLKEIKRLKATKAIIVADTGIISPTVDSQLMAAGVVVSRIGGADRYATSLLVAKELSGAKSAVIACGDNFPDALSMAPIAAKLGMPIILSNKQSLSEEALLYLKTSDISETYVIGGIGVLSANIDLQVNNPIRLAGDNRYSTGLAILNKFNSYFDFSNIYITTGNDFADALAIAPLAARNSYPVVLVGDTVSSEVNAYIRSYIKPNAKVTAMGGSNIVSDKVVKAVLTGSIMEPEIKTMDSSATVQPTSELYKFMSNIDNRESVFHRTLGLNYGNAHNACTIFLGEALRRTGINVSPSIVRTIKLNNFLTNEGWIRATDLSKLQNGDICFTTEDGNNEPTHVYIFMGWMNPGNFEYGYVCDNQGLNYGGNVLHQRNISIATAEKEAIRYYMHKK